MKIPAITGIIRRRQLLNYRVDPAFVRPLLPQPFQPKHLDQGMEMFPHHAKG